MLEIRGLATYYYSDNETVKALDGASLSLGKGQMVGLSGASGCGKSTLGLSLMQLIEPPGKIVKGSIKLDGRQLLGLPKEEIRQLRGKSISMVFQDPFTTLNPVLTIGDQLSECLRHHFSMGRKEAKERAVEALAKVKINDPAKRYASYAHELSGGMRQRVMIAMAVLCGARYLIADEITSALDVISQRHIMLLLEELRTKEGLSVLLISHNRPLLARHCSRIYEMKDGKCLN
ncbi:MAG: ABC transporter ATP-binding protein [Candidatus Margulisiibacteriota bacterium]